ncbi:MAG: DUF4260 family protein [Terrimonas sp.]|nr:DUF4260 family protein [Terrimonas sp.]
MKNLLKTEELLMCAAAVYALWFSGASWIFYLLMFIGPDIGMLGYCINNKTGAFTYNLFHHKAIAIVLFFAGYYTGSWGLLVTGIILFGHASMDRFFGYGLKLKEGFSFTHLGPIGKNKQAV